MTKPNEWPTCPHCNAIVTLDELQDNLCYGCLLPIVESTETSKPTEK